MVGAGSGGCVAARRLHDAGHDVVLVEAGPALLPGAGPESIDGADSFAAIAEAGRVHDGLVATRTRSSGERAYLRGRGIGGSSAVNFMVALRGDERLYRSWGWDDTASAFDRVLVPSEEPDDRELGRIDRVLLASDERACVAPLTRHDGRRVTAAEAYLWPILDSPRLRVITDRIVDVVTIDDSNAATGVRLAAGFVSEGCASERAGGDARTGWDLASEGVTVEADAVVLAAGAVHTPAILQRSGVTAIGIGDGLQDHPAAALLLRLHPRPRTGFVAGRRGLATAALIDADPIQVLGLNHLGAGSPPDTAMLLVALMRPVGKTGTVRIRSDDPWQHPTVDFDMLRDPSDLSRLRRGVLELLRMLDRPPLRDVVAEVLIDDSGTSSLALDSDGAIDRWLLAHGADYVHASSSCAGALDENGCVAGYEALYVCDTSAFPSIPNVNTHLPTMMLAERLCDRWIHDADDNAGVGVDDNADVGVDLPGS